MKTARTTKWKKLHQINSYRFTNVQKDIQFYFSANDYNSDEHHIRVLKKPMIANFSTNLNYPSYTGKKNETIKNTGDLIIPAGTTVDWNFETSGTDDVKVIIDGQTFSSSKNGKDNFSFLKKL